MWCARGWIHFHGLFARLIKAQFSVYLNRSYSVSTKLAGLLFAQCWGVASLRVGSKRCMASNTPLSSSDSFEGRPTELWAQEGFNSSCRDCIRALLFPKADDGTALSGCSQHTGLHICERFVYAATQLGGGGGCLSVSSWKPVTGREVLLLFSTSPPLY